VCQVCLPWDKDFKQQISNPGRFEFLMFLRVNDMVGSHRFCGYLDRSEMAFFGRERPCEDNVSFGNSDSSEICLSIQLE
jgi:hypothetical protein